MFAAIGAALLTALPGWAVTIVGGLIGKVFGVTAAPTVTAAQQAATDSASEADAMLKAKVEGDAINADVSATAAAGGLRTTDKFNIPAK